MPESIDIPREDMEQLDAVRSRIDALLNGPIDKTPDLDSALEELKSVRAKVATAGKRAIGDAAKAIFVKYPDVASISWTQYTPYFNDGDECTFRVNDPGVKFIAGSSVALEDNEDDRAGYHDSWSLGYYAKKEGKVLPEGLIEDLKAFDKLLNNAEDACKATFGDHCRVTISRDSEAEVEEYDHD